MPSHPHQAVLFPMLPSYILHPLCLEKSCPELVCRKGLGGVWVIRARAGACPARMKCSESRDAEVSYESLQTCCGFPALKARSELDEILQESQMLICDASFVMITVTLTKSL